MPAPADVVSSAPAGHAAGAPRRDGRSCHTPAPSHAGPPPGAAPTTFAAAALAYAADGSWVDEALRLLAEGDHVPGLTDAYRKLVDAVAAERLDGASRFAHLLAHWSRSEPVADTRLVPVEQVLEQIVAPVARAAPVLMVVCDGMGLPVAHRLVRDLLAEGWAPVVSLC